jgi:hypothetical protein
LEIHLEIEILKELLGGIRFCPTSFGNTFGNRNPERIIRWDPFRVPLHLEIEILKE